MSQRSRKIEKQPILIKIRNTYIWLFMLFIISCNSGSTERSVSDRDDELTGRVIKVLDGDTYDVLLPGNKTLRVRMEGIDAPERGMPFYRVSKNYLKSLCANKAVTVRITNKDQYDRYVGFTYLEDGTELSHAMIEAGLAWHFKKYNSDSDLSNLETEAKKLKKGLWHDKSPMPPWENRRLHRLGISTKDSFDIKEGQR